MPRNIFKLPCNQNMKFFYALIAVIVLGNVVTLVFFEDKNKDAPKTEKRIECPDKENGENLSKVIFNPDDSITCHYGSKAYRYVRKDAKYAEMLAECRTNAFLAVELAVKKGAMQIEGFDSALLFETAKATCMQDYHPTTSK